MVGMAKAEEGHALMQENSYLPSSTKKDPIVQQSTWKLAIYAISIASLLVGACVGSFHTGNTGASAIRMLGEKCPKDWEHIFSVNKSCTQNDQCYEENKCGKICHKWWVCKKYWNDGDGGAALDAATRIITTVYDLFGKHTKTSTTTTPKAR
eukprot:CAMPEP_0172658922 /NCGR_PEP_ID=MMETSP1074-20121228/3074_1 /TAXON_ID=2916 /ORGANISM="Ceratium fusus, Strain PA161109" /LENGTH=151 /DNA_ID=CAMNT_0013474287 /DNA_START=35 /DNA_END=490 /DNA_ORIENTATION=-